MEFLHASLSTQGAGFLAITAEACKEVPGHEAPAGSAVSPEVARARAAREGFRRHVGALLRCEHLLVLTGLGTSLGIRDCAGNSKFPKMGDLWDAAKNLDPTTFERVCAEARYTGQTKNIEDLLSRAAMLERLQPEPSRKKFVEDAERMIWEKCSYFPEEEELWTHGLFLNSLVRRPTKLNRTKLFTTNYDLCFERAASGKGFVVIDGFSHTHPQRFSGSHFEYDLVRRRPDDGGTPEYLSNVFHLYKLHGSVDWTTDAGSVYRCERPPKPVMIYPRDSKFQASYDQPFFEVMSRFHANLRKPDLGLLVVGFGFNDDHIVQPIRSALESNISLKMLVVDPYMKDKLPAPVSMQTAESPADADAGVPQAATPTPPASLPHLFMKRLIEQGDDRVGLFHGSFEDLVRELPLLISNTDEELHVERVRKAART